MRHSWFAALGALIFALCVAPSAFAQRNTTELRDIQIESLAIAVRDGDGEFNVIDARMDETGTAAAFFGLVGAVANSAANNVEDQNAADPYRAAADLIDLETLIGQAIVARLQERNPVPLAATPEAASHTLVVEYGDWGLIRRAQRPDMAVRTFLKLNISIVDARGRRVWGITRDHSVGQTALALQSYPADLFKTEMEALAARAGQGIANRIIYR
jgi:hypothetical protein